VGTPRSSSAVAGAGMLHSPCAILIRPDPVGTGEATTRSTPNRSQPTAAPTMSAIESAAPHLVEVDLPDGAAVDPRLGLGQGGEDPPGRSRCRGPSCPESIMARIWLNCRWACSGSQWTVICKARKPCFFTSVAHQQAGPADPTSRSPH